VQAQELVYLNVLAPVLLTRSAVTGMLARRRGSIINVASQAPDSAAQSAGVKLCSWNSSDAAYRAKRVSALRRAADVAGWQVTREENLPGGANLRFKRDDLTAVVFIWADRRAGPCREAPRNDCADAILVVRS
jgi:hypothetical protein